MEGNPIRLDNNGEWKGQVIIKKAGYKPVIKHVSGITYEECEEKLIQLKIANGVIDSDLFSPKMLFCKL